MLRPRESRELHLISSQITVRPDAILTWARDVFGNAVATATSQMTVTNLVIATCSASARRGCMAGVRHRFLGDVLPILSFCYSNDDWIDVGALAAQHILRGFLEID
jgi:Bacterial transglutaminase-like N-terminal region